MSNTTAAFDAAMSRTNKVVRLILDISFVDATGAYTRTLNLSNESGFIGGVFYVAAIEDPGTVNAPGSLLSNDVGLATASVVLNNVRLDADGLTLLKLASQESWAGAEVSLGVWETSTDVGADVAWPLRKAFVEQVRFEPERITLELRQRTDWNNAVSSRAASREEYAQLPEASVGAAISTRLGDAPMMGMRRPWLAAYDNRHPSQGLTGVRELSKCGPIQLLSGTNTGKAILVDAGRGSAASSAKIVVAGHKLANIADIANGYALFMDNGNGLSIILPDPADVFNTDTEAGFYIRDNSPTHVLVVKPNGFGETGTVSGAGVNADVRRLVDTQNEISFVDLNIGSGLGYLASMLCAPPQYLGSVVEYGVVVWCKAPVGTNAVVQLIFDPGLTSAIQVPHREFAIPEHADPKCHVFTCDGALSSVVAPANGNRTMATVPWPTIYTNLRCGLVNNGVNINTRTLRLFGMGLLVRYIPQQETIEPGKTVTVTKTVPVRKKPGQPPTHGDGVATYQVQETLPPTTELRGKFFASSAGMPDDASATFAGGSPAGVVKRPTDVMHQVLSVFGREPELNITTGSAFGSFTSARDLMKTWRGTDMRVGMNVADDSSVSAILSHLMGASFSWCFLSPWDDKWKVVPLKPGMPVTWSRKVSAKDLKSKPKLNTTPGPRLVSGVRMPYAFDEFEGTFKSEVSVMENSSSGGRDFFSVRHESLDVTANLNDRLELRKAGVAATLQIAAGSHTYETLCSDLRRLNTTFFHGYKWAFGFGGVAATGCYRLGYTAIASAFVWDMVKTKYTMEGLAQAFNDQLASRGITNITWAYSRTTKKFTVTNNSAFSFTVDAGGATAVNDNGWALFGFWPVTRVVAAAGTLSSDFAVEEEVFVLSANGVFDWPIQKGAYGHESAAPKQIGQVLGFELAADFLGVQVVTGSCPKNTRERTLRDMSRRYLRHSGSVASRRPATLDGRSVFDGDTAREVVSRAVDLFGKIALEISFEAERMFGIERGMVFEFDADMDSLMPYPDPDSDGSWVGKRFFVTETEQRLGPSTFDTALVAVSI